MILNSAIQYTEATIFSQLRPVLSFKRKEGVYRAFRQEDGF